MCKNRGLSLAESMVSLLVMSVVVAATIPIMTKMSETKTGVNQRVVKCITNGTTSDYFTDADGSTNEPTSGTDCYYAYTAAKYSNENAMNTLKWQSTHGTADQQFAAKKLMRTTCDEGGKEACDYFINKCMIDSECDNSGAEDYLDLAYYLNSPVSTSNEGIDYVKEKVEELLPRMSQNILAQVKASCDANSNSIACDLDQPWIYIKGCNLGYIDACEEAHDNNYNKSCSQIKSVWEDAPSDTYNLTYDGASNLNSANCNMTTVPIAAISGCNYITSDSDNCTASSDSDDDCSDDCLIAHTNNYNRECNDILQNWIGAPLGNYNLTADGPPPTALVVEECQGAVPNCTDKVGSVCLDGTVYAGTYNTKEIFTTLADVAETGLAWNDGTLNWTTRYAGFTPTPNSESDGKYNSYVINNWTNGTWIWGTIEDAPYYAAKACEDLNDSSYLGYTDWYLPSINELHLLCAGKSDIGGFAETRYWSSTEADSDQSYYNEFWNCGNKRDYQKNKTFRVRCIRNNEEFTEPDMPDTTPRVAVNCSSGSPDIGALCSDGTVYAGEINGNSVYVPEQDQGIYTGNDGSTDWQTRYVNFEPIPNNLDDGETNTYIMNNWVDNTYPWGIIEDAPYKAANACQNLSDANYLGYDDWYLPSYTELLHLYQNKDAIGYFRNSDYWTSTEYNSSNMRYRRFSDGYNYWRGKNETKWVRCIRNDGSFTPPAMPTAPPTVNCHDGTEIDAGDRCFDGTIYAGEYGSPVYKYFVAPNDEPGGYPSNKVYYWNNGTDEDWENTGATSVTDGASNFATLIVATDDGAPYYAAKACESLNDVSYLGYADWFLPSRGELAYILTNYEAIGTFANTLYWTSTERDSDEAYRIHSDASAYHSNYYETKNNARRVRCVRKEL